MNGSDDSGFTFAESVARPTFDDDVYAHLSALVAVEFSREGSPAQAGTFELNASKYQALEQAAFEEAPRIEARPPDVVDWGRIDVLVSKFETELEQSLNRVPNARAGDPRVFVEFSSRCFENYQAYLGMYPDSDRDRTNPWRRTISIMQRGRLLAIGDAGGLERARGRGAPQRSERQSSQPTNVMALVKGAAPKPATMAVDDRFDQQAKLLNFLKTNARGHVNKLPLREIAAHLRTLGIRMTEASIQVKLTVPLKRTGVIGSNSKGFFFIDSLEDVVQSYCFHRTKVLSASKIMQRYQARARDMDPDLNLADECSASGPILNRGLL